MRQLRHRQAKLFDPEAVTSKWWSQDMPDSSEAKSSAVHSPRLSRHTLGKNKITA